MSDAVEVVTANVQHWGGFYPADADAALRLEQLVQELKGSGPNLAKIAEAILADAEFGVELEGNLGE